MTENTMKSGCLQKDSAEYESYAGVSRSFNRIWKERDSAKGRLIRMGHYDLFHAYQSVHVK